MQITNNCFLIYAFTCGFSSLEARMPHHYNQMGANILVSVQF